MARILIVYASKYGQTEKIAKFLQQRLMEHGNQVELLNAFHPQLVSFSDYEGVIVGAPIYMLRYPRLLRRWVSQHAEDLNRTQSAFFSVCMAAAEKDEKAQRQLLSISENFFKKTGWYPRRRKVFAGGVSFTKYNWFVKRLMDSISRRSGTILDTQKDHEFTKWSDVAKFGDDFLQSLRSKRDLENLSP